MTQVKEVKEDLQSVSKPSLLLFSVLPCFVFAGPPIELLVILFSFPFFPSSELGLDEALSSSTAGKVLKGEGEIALLFPKDFNEGGDTNTSSVGLSILLKLLIIYPELQYRRRKESDGIGVTTKS